MTPREAAIDRYEADYERFAESAQLYAGTSLAQAVAGTALMFLVAADAERWDPKPFKDRVCACEVCRLYRMLADKEPPAMESVA
jgi:hypothetical protein